MFRIGFYQITEIVGGAACIFGDELLTGGLDPCVHLLMSSWLHQELTWRSA